MCMREVAQAWLTASRATHKDYRRNNGSRVRKLFGAELQERGREWVEVPNARLWDRPDLRTHEGTQAILSTLKGKRLEEGCKPGTISREMSLLHSLLGFAKSIGAPMSAPPIKWSARNNRAASLKLPETKGRMRWLTVEEERKLLDGLMFEADQRPGDTAALDSWHLCQFLLDTGARNKEIATLTWWWT